MAVLGMMSLAGCCTVFHIDCPAEINTAQEAIKKCASSGIRPTDSIVYFGPTGSPIGTIYEKVAADTFDPLWPGTMFTGEKPPKKIVEPPVYGNCTFNNVSSIDLKMAFKISANPIPASAGVSNDFKNSKVVDMKAQAFGWQILYKGPYKDLVKAKQSAVDDINLGNRWSCLALLKVKGYSVTLDVSNEDIAALSVKYPNGQILGNKTDLGADVSVNWTDHSKLTFIVQEETTIAGVLREWVNGTLTSGSNEASDGFGDSFVSSNPVLINVKH